MGVGAARGGGGCEGESSARGAGEWVCGWNRGEECWLELWVGRGAVWRRGSKVHAGGRGTVNSPGAARRG